MTPTRADSDRWTLAAIGIPNVLSLDAPVVAVAWHALLVRNFGGAPSSAGTEGPLAGSFVSLVLFLTVWLIYMVDRLADARHLDRSRLAAPRHRFAERWSPLLWPLCGLVFLVDSGLIMLGLDWRTLTAGSGVFAIVLAYGWAIHGAGGLRRRIPKEFIVGTVFAMGTCLPLVSHRATPSLLATVALLAGLFTLNCLCVSMAQRESDRSQGVTSAVLMFPSLSRRLATAAAVVLAALVTLACVVAVPPPIILCAALSGAGLLVLAWMMQRECPRAGAVHCGYAADYLLLSPVVVMALAG